MVAQPAVPNMVPVRPNIVLLLADDLSLSVMDVAAQATLDDGSWFMPNFRRYILDKAVEFRQAFSPNPVCCPARGTLLTGQYSHNHGALTNVGRSGSALQLRDGSDRNGDGVPEGDTIALALQRAGYRTAHVGKYLNGYGVLINVPAGPARRAVSEELFNRYGPKGIVTLPAVPETGRAYEPPGWTEWYGSFDVSTYCMYNTIFSVDGRPTLFHTSGQTLDPDALPNPLPPAGTANYQTDVIKDLTLRFLDRHGTSPDPLFLSVNTLASHVESCDWAYARLNDFGPLPTGATHPFIGNIDPSDQGGQGYRGHFLDTVRPAPADMAHLERFRQMAAGFLGSTPSFDEVDVSDKPSFIRSKAVSMCTPYDDAPNGSPGDRYPYSFARSFVPENPAIFNRDISRTNPREQAVDQFARMMAALGAFDRMIGAIAQRLEAQGRLSNTVFVFTSDNGYSHGQHRLSTKLLAYEESTRVPFFVSLPAMTGGPRRSWAMVLHTDVAPTFLDLASTPESPARLRFTPDGTSFKALLQYPGIAWRKQALIEHFAQLWPDEPLSLANHPSLFAVRTSYHNGVVPNRTYTEYFDGMQYGGADGPHGWPAGFYRGNCRPEAPIENCAGGATYRVPIRPFIYTSGQNPDRLPDREYYNLDLDRFQLSNGFGAGVPGAIRDGAVAESPTLRCRLDALVACAGRACQAAEWAADCP